MKIFACGDSHGNFMPIFDWIENHAEEGDVLTHVGDFGEFAVPKWILEDLGKESAKKSVQILVTRGNHSSPIYYQENRKYGNLEFMSDYSTRTINGKKVLFIGGAISIDRAWRKEGIDYWADEKVIYDLSLLDGIEDVDVMVSHTCPDFLSPAPKNFSNIQWALDKDPLLKDELIFERKYMTQVWEKLKEKNDIREWYGGHFHVSLLHIIGKTKFRFVGIDEICMSNEYE